MIVSIAFLSSIWSDEKTPTIDLPNRLSISRIPKQMAGRVFFPSGSISTLSAGMSYSSSLICPMTKNFWDSFVTMKISDILDTLRHRRKVSWNSDVSPSFKNCFGYCSRLSGHRRVPEPPARIMDLIVFSSCVKLFYLKIYASSTLCICSICCKLVLSCYIISALLISWDYSSRKFFNISQNHHFHEFFEIDLRFPSKNTFGFG